MLSLNEITTKLSKLKGWELEGSTITKNLTFQNFKEAIDYLNKVAEIAEKYNHHPDISISYTAVRLTLTTHSERALTETDFEVAEEIDKILLSFTSTQ